VSQLPAALGDWLVYRMKKKAPGSQSGQLILFHFGVRVFFALAALYERLVSYQSQYC